MGFVGVSDWYRTCNVIRCMGHIDLKSGPWCRRYASKRNDLAAREARTYDTSNTHRGRSAHETADRDDLLFIILPDPESTGRIFRAADQLRKARDSGPGQGPLRRRVPGPPEGMP